MKKLLVILSIIGLLTACSHERPEMVTDPVEYVSTLTGTLSHHAFSTGNTYPAIALPWGMNFWTPVTGKMGDGWAYRYDQNIIRGLKQTHQPSPWINDYGQFSLFFKNDAEAKRAANKMLKEGYIAVLSSSQYEPDPFEKFAMGFIVFLMMAIWVGGVIGLAFFIRLCQSRSIVSFKNDIAIMRSMGIKAAVIKISMYMRSVIAVIPAGCALFVVAALIFTTPELNGFFTYLYGWQYALICFGLLLIAIRVSFKQQGKLFEGSVKKTLTGGELND